MADHQDRVLQNVPSGHELECPCRTPRQVGVQWRQGLEFAERITDWTEKAIRGFAPELCANLREAEVYGNEYLALPSTDLRTEIVACVRGLARDERAEHGRVKTGDWAYGHIWQQSALITNGAPL